MRRHLVQHKTVRERAALYMLLTLNTSVSCPPIWTDTLSHVRDAIQMKLSRMMDSHIVTFIFWCGDGFNQSGLQGHEEGSEQRRMWQTPKVVHSPKNKEQGEG